MLSVGAGSDWGEGGVEIERGLGWDEVGGDRRMGIVRGEGGVESGWWMRWIKDLKE